MTARAPAAIAALAWLAAAIAAPAPKAPAPARVELSAEQIVEKNVAARGGLEAWRKIDTMRWVGHVPGASGTEQPLAFVMHLQRPNKTHFEISSIDRHFARVFDGKHGWRVRPGNGGIPELKAFSNEEVAFSRDEFVIDGPLIDHLAKGVAVKLAGIDEIDGRKAYLLEVTLPGSGSRRIWIDAETFLDFRVDRPSTSPLTKGAAVSTYYSDFRPVDGLLIPHTIETRASSSPASQAFVIDRVALNPALNAQVFAKPVVPKQRHAAIRLGPANLPPASAASARSTP